MQSTISSSLSSSVANGIDKKKLPVEGCYLGLLLVADNCWLIEMSDAELQTMAREWYGLLNQAGLNIDWGEAVWCTTAHDILPGSIAVSGTTTIRRRREEGFRALGVWTSRRKLLNGN